MDTDYDTTLEFANSHPINNGLIMGDKYMVNIVNSQLGCTREWNKLIINYNHK